jgi:hypothetical protein
MQVARVCETSKPEFSLTFIAPPSEKEKRTCAHKYGEPPHANPKSHPMWFVV